MADSLNIQNNLDKEGRINVLEYCTHNDILNSYKLSRYLYTKFSTENDHKILSIRASIYHPR